MLDVRRERPGGDRGGLRGLGGDPVLGDGVAEEVGGCPKELSFAALQEDLFFPTALATQRGRGWYALSCQGRPCLQALKANVLKFSDGRHEREVLPIGVTDGNFGTCQNPFKQSRVVWSDQDEQKRLYHDGRFRPIGWSTTTWFKRRRSQQKRYEVLLGER
eukprot:508037-Hanusia_phi.AAC.1